MIYFAIVFFLPLTFLLLRFLSAVSNSSTNHIFHSFPALSRLLLMQSPIAISVVIAFISPSTFWASALFASFLSPNFHMTSPCTHHQFLLRTVLHSNLHSHLIHFLISCLYSHNYSYQVVFSQTWTFSCSFSVSAIVSSPFLYAGATHKRSTFPLPLRYMHLSPITPSNSLYAFAPAVILIVT